MSEDEIYKPSPSLGEGYEITNYGRIFRYEGIRPDIKTAPWNFHKLHEQFIYNRRESSHGYHTVTVMGKTHYVHRLVAEAHIPNPHGYKYVRHINGDKTHNSAKNLEWVEKPQMSGLEKLLRRLRA